jgi:hypothetical protein
VSIEWGVAIVLSVACGILIGQILALRPATSRPRHAKRRHAWPATEYDDPRDLQSTVVRPARVMRYARGEGR